MHCSASRRDDSPVARDIDLIRRYGSDACVLISVDQSRDAEEVAGTIHAMTPSPRGRFKSVDCTVADQMLEESLFGRLEAAAAGPPCTLFLKEVGRLGQAQQRRLLRALIDATVLTWPDRTPARVIASTSESLFDRVVIGTFD